MRTVDLAWGKKVSPRFVAAVGSIVRSFGWDPEQGSDLMACMAFESARTFSPSIRNGAGSGATGLIQFMPSTARGFGTTTESMALMSAEEQLSIYVRQYFKPYAKRIYTLSDMYMAILLPSYIDAADTEVLFTRGGTPYRQNAGLDANSDGRITKAEAAARVIAMRAEGLRPENVLTGVTI